MPLTKAFAELGGARGGFWSFCAPPKEGRKTPLRPAAVKAQEYNQRKNEVWSKHIGTATGMVSRIHFHPSVVGLGMWSKNHKKYLQPKAVPQELAQRIAEEGYSYTCNDNVPGKNDYFPVPNYRISDAERDLAAASVYKNFCTDPCGAPADGSLGLMRSPELGNLEGGRDPRGLRRQRNWWVLTRWRLLPASTYWKRTTLSYCDRTRN